MAAAGNGHHQRSKGHRKGARAALLTRDLPGRRINPSAGQSAGGGPAMCRTDQRRASLFPLLPLWVCCRHRRVCLCVCVRVCMRACVRAAAAAHCVAAGLEVRRPLSSLGHLERISGCPGGVAWKTSGQTSGKLLGEEGWGWSKGG